MLIHTAVHSLTSLPPALPPPAPRWPGPVRGYDLVSDTTESIGEHKQGHLQAATDAGGGG